MPALPTDLRSKLEKAIIAAREVAEAGAQAALEALAVHHYEPYTHQSPEQRRLRVQLRARARQLGDALDAKGYMAIGHLAKECAYEYWHRMLFARFLAENNLLIEPNSGVAITLSDAEELAKDARTDMWTYVSRCAQQMLPQIFRPDDPLLQVGFASEHRVKLERLLAGLDAATFTADDSLGWVYQFWQSAEKDRVNDSGEKITGDTLSAVTQLFTEHYMVLFLLHNTIGAWHAGKILAANPNLAQDAPSEDALRKAVALKSAGGYSFDYLRFVRGADGKGGPWRPAAGTFDGWPKVAAEITVLDPCCGSGHFLVAAFELLVRLRMDEEGLDLSAALDAVLKDNLHGLELDNRCTQIAAFNLALAAWKLAGHRPLPAMHIACTGIGPSGTMEEWISFANKASWRMTPLERPYVEDGLKAMHELFSQAPTLGSLINPHQLKGSLITADYETLKPHLAQALSAELGDDLAHERAVAAAGMAKAAEILAGDYTLVITNVPYLGRGKQDLVLQTYLSEYYPEGKADLAAAFVQRCLEFCEEGGSAALVTPQSWLFLTTYTKLRESLLKRCEWNIVARLGPGAFETIGGHVVNVALLAITAAVSSDTHIMAGTDVSAARKPEEKAAFLRDNQSVKPTFIRQAMQLRNPDSVVLTTSLTHGTFLRDFSKSYHGISTTDYAMFGRSFWEISKVGFPWIFQQSTVDATRDFCGKEHIMLWEDGQGKLLRLRQLGVPVVITGIEAWMNDGIAISQMNDLPVTRYLGTCFDDNTGVIIPDNQSHLPALWAYCSSIDFSRDLRVLDQSIKVTYPTLVKVPFDLAHWQKVAKEKYPNGLPEPESDDPTQWLFHGRPEESTAPLQVAVARMLGYRWPAELDENMRLSKRARDLVAKSEQLLKFADDDGIICIPSVRGEEPASDRLLALLSACGIKPDRSLDQWLRDDFFAEHCKLFHDRPFVWHIWDGRKRDGFHALVNCHKLADGKNGRKLLENLTYSYLGDWITRQRESVRHGEDGAEDRLAAALELQKRLVAIIEGEPPYDIFVRWKPLHQQPIGWEPDINDGVRLNIRPFLASDLPNGKKGAGILRCKPNIKWDKDRGKEPERKKSEYPWFWGWDGTVDFMGGTEFKGERFNDCHYTLTAKHKASNS